jgi:hypothetical protein
VTSHFEYDMPENYYFGGGSDTFITPLALGILLLAVILSLGLPRKLMIVPLLVAGLLLPQGINVVVSGLHFPGFRLLLLAGWVRFAIRRDIHIPRMDSLDKAVLLWALCNAIAFSLLWGNLGAVTNRLGFLFTSLGTYFLVHSVIRDKDDVLRTIKALAIVAALVAPLMFLEHITRHNAFSIVGAPELSDVREGAVRAKGPFSHAIIAGTIGAMLMPLFIGLWWQGKRYRRFAVLGVLSSTVMAISSASSTPIMTCAAGVFALLLWPARRHLSFFRWGLVLSIVSLHLVMKAPVWFLISRAGGTMGGSGEHRALLIDNFIRRFGEWWLIGTRNNADWGYDMWDVDNAYVAAGIGGGLITFLAFIAVFVYAYKRLGNSRKLAERSPKNEHLIWTIGASLFANTVGFFGIVYFDQSVLAWYALLAIVSATAALVADRKQTRFELGVAGMKMESTSPVVPAAVQRQEINRLASLS